MINKEVLIADHWSDCSVYNAPALPTGDCDCGGLNLADNSSHGLVAPLVPVARSAAMNTEQPWPALPADIAAVWSTVPFRTALADLKGRMDPK